jgi:hypothetical protein
MFASLNRADERAADDVFKPGNGPWVSEIVS